jgi:hypothetical protein
LDYILAASFAFIAPLAVEDRYLFWRLLGQIFQNLPSLGFPLTKEQTGAARF